ncbi:gas vesicle protein [Actinomycetospora atypica]|uniref:Gas vesicle protein n=1 Tax=Actinomycetospora atypica TaxID=1290095 RepID=A0ABV9YJX2_9PSEU
MSDPVGYNGRMPSARQQQQPAPSSNGGGGTNLADILERVLDKGIVIAGDVQINLLDIELLTIKLRLVVASVDKAKEMGIDWWERDPTLSSGHSELEKENRRLRERLEALEGRPAAQLDDAEPEVEDVEEPAAEPDEADIDDADIVEDEPEPEPEPAPRRRRSTRRDTGGGSA